MKIDGIISYDSHTGAWIITRGLRAGITKLIGEAVRDHAFASTSAKIKVFAIGISPLGIISDSEALDDVKVNSQIVNLLSPILGLSVFNELISSCERCLYISV